MEVAETARLIEAGMIGVTMPQLQPIRCKRCTNGFMTQFNDEARRVPDEAARCGQCNGWGVIWQKKECKSSPPLPGSEEKK